MLQQMIDTQTIDENVIVATINSLVDASTPDASRQSVRKFARTPVTYTMSGKWTVTIPFALYASRHDMVDILNALYKQGADLDKIRDGYNRHLIIHAASAGQSRVVAFFIDVCGYSVDHCDKWGNTVLHYAKNAETVAVLLERGADVNATNHDGSTPLNCSSVSYHDDETLELLIQHGADVNAVGNYGTSLYMVANHGHVSTVKLLLNHGANVDIPNENGVTPLLGTVCQSEYYDNIVQVCKVLLEAGANVSTRLKNGQTPLRKAAWQNSTELMALLLEYGADHTDVNITGKGRENLVNFLKTLTVNE